MVGNTRGKRVMIAVKKLLERKSKRDSMRSLGPSQKNLLKLMDRTKRALKS